MAHADFSPYAFPSWQPARFDTLWEGRKLCETDDDCADNYICVESIWEDITLSKANFKSGKGCHRNSVCLGTGAFQLFNE